VTGESTENSTPPRAGLPVGLRILTIWMALGGALSVWGALMSVIALSAAIGFPESRSGNDELLLFGALTLLQLILGIFWLETAWGLWRRRTFAYGHAVWGIFLSAVLGTLWIFLLRTVAPIPLANYLFILAQAVVGLVYLFRPEVHALFHTEEQP
jgi:hypothetical protein